MQASDSSSFSTVVPVEVLEKFLHHVNEALSPHERALTLRACAQVCHHFRAICRTLLFHRLDINHEWHDDCESCVDTSRCVSPTAAEFVEMIKANQDMIPSIQQVQYIARRKDAHVANLADTFSRLSNARVHLTFLKANQSEALLLLPIIGHTNLEVFSYPYDGTEDVSHLMTSLATCPNLSTVRFNVSYGDFITRDGIMTLFSEVSSRSQDDWENASDDSLDDPDSFMDTQRTLTEDLLRTFVTNISRFQHIRALDLKIYLPCDFVNSFLEQEWQTPVDSIWEQLGMILVSLPELRKVVLTLVATSVNLIDGLDNAYMDRLGATILNRIMEQLLPRSNVILQCSVETRSKDYNLIPARHIARMIPRSFIFDL